MGDNLRLSTTLNLPEDPADAALTLEEKEAKFAEALETAPFYGSQGFVGTVEHLLSALEASGIDNARIEVEGNGEIPILDGSAYPFCYHAARVGLVPAVSKEEVSGGGGGGEEVATVPRMAWKPTQMVMVGWCWLTPVSRS